MPGQYATMSAQAFSACLAMSGVLWAVVQCRHECTCCSSVCTWGKAAPTVIDLFLLRRVAAEVLAGLEAAALGGDACQMAALQALPMVLLAAGPDAIEAEAPRVQGELRRLWHKGELEHPSGRSRL